MALTKAVRFSEKDLKLVDEFLRDNPFFDFSTLARTAILQFIRCPSIGIKAVKQGSRKVISRHSTGVNK